MSPSCAVSIPPFIPPSSSTSTILQHAPFTLSFSSILAPDIPRAPHQSATVPAVTVVVDIIFLVFVVVAGLTICSLSCAEMAADIKSLDVLRTLVVYGCHVHQRLALMWMWRVVSQSEWGWGSNSWPWRRLAGVIVVVGPSCVVIVVVDGEMAVLPPPRAYTGGGGRIHAIWSSWGHQMHEKDLT